MKKALPFLILAFLFLGISFSFFQTKKSQEDLDLSSLKREIDQLIKETIILASQLVNQKELMEKNNDLIWQLVNEGNEKNSLLQEKILILTEKLKELIKNLKKISSKEKREKLSLALEEEIEALNFLINFSKNFAFFKEELEKEEPKEKKRVFEKYKDILENDFSAAQERSQKFLEVLKEIP